MSDLQVVWSQHIIVADWVGRIDEVPFPSLSIDLQAEGCVNMDGHIPKPCRHHDLLLTSPHSRVDCLGDIFGEGKDWVLGPDLVP